MTDNFYLNVLAVYFGSVVVAVIAIVAVDALAKWIVNAALLDEEEAHK